MDRQRIAVFAAGFFALGLVPVTTVAVPLWALEIGASPMMIGLALGARAALSVPFSIHGGALMDRVGINRITAFSALTAAVLFVLYPALPSIAALIVLQLLTGFLQALMWMGAQTHISRLRRDDPGLMGRFTFVSTTGNIVGPLLCGAAWDALGPWGAFAMIGLWSAATLATVPFLPRHAGQRSQAGVAAGLAELLPRWADYGLAFRLVATPEIGFVIACSFLMTCTHALRHSFYPVYLESIGLGGTLIGALIATGSVVSALSGLGTGPALRRMRAGAVLGLAVVATTLCITAIVLVQDYAVLVGLATVWGLGAGISFPVILYLLSLAIDPAQQGMGIGLRTSVNRIAGMIVPVGMGALVGWIGLTGAFMAAAATILGALALVGAFLRPASRKLS